MDVKSLYTLIAAADHGSFAEAAEKIGVSVSAVSVQIKALEDEIGRTLFDRTRRPPVLTNDGQEVVARARDVIERWEGLSESLKNPTDQGKLKLGAVHTAVSGILPPALKVLRGRLPDLSLELGTGLTHELEAHVRRRRIDAAIISEPEVIAADMRFTPFVTERLVVIAPENCPGKTHEEVLTSQPYIRFNRAARVGRMIERHLANREIKVRTKMEIDTLEGVLALVANGLGVTVAPDVRAVHPFPTNLRVLPFGDEMASRTLGLLELSDNPRTRFVERLLEALQEVSAPSSTPAAVSA